jgi:AraC-like DNA-binding protein
VADFLSPGVRNQYWRASLPTTETRLLKTRLISVGNDIGPANTGLRYAYCLEFFMKCLEQIMAAYSPSEQILSAPLVRVILRIEKDFPSLLTLENLASEAGLSISRFSALFKAKMAIAPMHYLRRHLLGRAGSLLRHTDWQVEEIATCTGFNSLHYFSRAFKAEFGRSPRAYREQSRKTG